MKDSHLTTHLTNQRLVNLMSDQFTPNVFTMVILFIVIITP